MNFAKFLRKPFLQNNFGRLLLLTPDKTFNSRPNLRLVVIVKFVFIKNYVLVTKVKADSSLTVIGDFPQYFKGS